MDNPTVPPRGAVMTREAQPRPAFVARLSELGRPLLDRYLPQGALLLSVLTFGSYLMGLVRDRFFARTFGAGAELDAYNAAFVVPELLFDVIVAGGLAAPFVPVFSKLATEDQDAAHDFGRTVLTVGLIVMAALSALLFVIAPIEPLTFQFFTNVASAFVAGSVSSVSFARNFQSVPVSLIGVAFSLAAFPALSAAAAVGDRRGFLRILRQNVLTIAVLTGG